MGIIAPTTKAKMLNAASLLMIYLIALRCATPGLLSVKLYAREPFLLLRALPHAFLPRLRLLCAFQEPPPLQLRRPRGSRSQYKKNTAITKAMGSNVPTQSEDMKRGVPAH